MDRQNLHEFVAMVALAIAMVVQELVEVCSLHMDTVHNRARTRKFLYLSQAIKHEISLSIKFHTNYSGVPCMIPLKCVLETVLE